MVQGVGFRPFVYRHAAKYDLTGWVRNTNENVRICISGKNQDAERFLSSFRAEAPPASMIEDIEIQEMEPEAFADFAILHSHDVSDDITEISPDIAVCNECMEDIEREGTRLNYAFVNCTNCGPRFTIIRDLPYDRAKTTMSSFPMCPGCIEEYESITDRRFHAQPTACEICGPEYELFIKGKKVSADTREILQTLSGCLDQGGTALIKGLGGMHLACNAVSETAVDKLRNLKKRDGKPFAIMFRDIATLKRYVTVEDPEEKSLLSWRRPIVLLPFQNTINQDDSSYLTSNEFKEHEKPLTGNHNQAIHYDDPSSVDLLQPSQPDDLSFSETWHSDQDNNPSTINAGLPKQNKLASNINSGLNLLGVMLPYMPFQHLLFQRLKTDAIVLTSGNFSSEPILIDNRDAILQFSDHMDMMVLHNRDIFNRTDDSVVRVMAGKDRIFRRSRGYVPTPVRTSMDMDGILAFGAELTNCFCIGKGKKAFLSQHIGDLQGYETMLFYEQTIDRFLNLFRVKPSLLAVDMHPEYISTKTAQHFRGLPVVNVQHHHAHIASCMTEHHLDEKVIGIALDGTGFGDDGHSWGSEFLVCDLMDYTRVTHFDYIPLPGGDLAAEEPWRMAVSWLYRVYGADFITLDLPLLREIEPDKIDLITHMISRNINCPLTSGAGRLFDAVASLLGLCQIASFQAEGPMRLESMVAANCNESYEFDMGQPIRFDATIRGIVNDLKEGVDIKIIASKFHNTIISVIFEAANSIRLREGIAKVVLSGGVFQNQYLLEGAIALLKAHDFEVYTHAAIPTNDGGIALGQIAIASKRRNQSCV